MPFSRCEFVKVTAVKATLYLRQQIKICLYSVFYVYGSVHRWSILITVQRDATQSILFIILQVHSTCFRRQPHPSSGVHLTVNTASVTGHIFCAATSLQRGQAGLATLEGGICTKNVTSTGDCSYSFVYSWRWVWLTPETCTVNLQNTVIPRLTSDPANEFFG